MLVEAPQIDPLLVAEIDQVLLAVGGKASRLTNPGEGREGIDVPNGKSFLTYRGVPLLEYTLDTLHREGMRRYVFAYETEAQYKLTETLVTRVADKYGIQDAEYVKDDGEGATGLPWHAMEAGVLDDQFVYDFGHNAAREVVCDLLIPRKKKGIVVFKAFHPGASLKSNHPLVSIHRDTDIIVPSDFTNPRYEAAEIAAPFVLDQEWVADLPRYGFRFADMIAARAERGNMANAALIKNTEFHAKGKVIYDATGKIDKGSYLKGIAIGVMGEYQYERAELDTIEDYERLFDRTPHPLQGYNDPEMDLSNILPTYARIPERTSLLMHQIHEDNYRDAVRILHSAIKSGNLEHSILARRVARRFAGGFHPYAFGYVAELMKDR